VEYLGRSLRNVAGRKRTARTMTSTPPSTLDRPTRFAIQVAKVVVSSVVVLHAISKSATNISALCREPTTKHTISQKLH
jgi:hypothetical protein